MSFWHQLPTNFVGLSPMDGVTDQVFRHIYKKYGRPDLVFTEFVSAEGLCHNASSLLQGFWYDASQRPIVAQIFGKTPKYFRQTAVLLCELGFDGIDINMGCPAKSVRNSGSGAALILEPELAVEIVHQTKLGVEDFMNGMRVKDCPDMGPKVIRGVAELKEKLKTNEFGDKKTNSQPIENKSFDKKPTEPIPVSVKTRLGYDKAITHEWIGRLLETQPVTISLHGRTLKQQYSGQADWEEIGKAVELARGSGVLMVGNGDVKNRAQAEKKCKEYGVDGVLIGRAAYGNPFVFADSNKSETNSKHNPNVTLAPNSQDPHSSKLPANIDPQIFQIALEHCQLYEKTYTAHTDKFFFPMRKNLGWYVKGFPDAAQVRRELFQTNNSDEVEEIFRKYKLI